MNELQVVLAADHDLNQLWAGGTRVESTMYPHESGRT